MAKSDKKNDETEEPTVLEEPGVAEEAMADEAADSVWMRGLWMLVFVILMWPARGILIVAGLIQFLWLLFAGERNDHIAEFGEDLGDWMARATIYVSGATEDRPFPFDRWGIPD